MKYQKIVMCIFILFTVTNCSETNGLFGKSGTDGDPFANISQSSLDYFSNELGDTILFKVNQSVIEPEYRDVLNSQASWIKEKSKLPVLVKGILRPDDAVNCFKNGANGLIISNHGGRQLDTAVPTLKQILPIREAVGNDKLIIVDGGIRRGTDVLKCLALGADAVQLGRPILWGLGYDGQKGVELVLNLLHKELIESMVLTGCKNLKEIDSDLITKC